MVRIHDRYRSLRERDGFLVMPGSGERTSPGHQRSEDLLALGSELSQAVGTTVDLVSLEDPGFALLEELIRDSVPIHEAAAGDAARWRSHALSELDLDRPGFERMRDAWLARVAREGL